VSAIERYERGVSWIRDGAWVTFVLAALFGQFGLANAFLLGGASWFGLTLLLKAPRAAIAVRRAIAPRWRLINRLLLLNVVVITLTNEAARVGGMTPSATTSIMVTVVTMLAIVTLAVWAYSPRTE
jgi:glucose dehydrogenase